MSKLSICAIGYEVPSNLKEAVVSGEVKNPYSLMRGLVSHGHELTIFSIPFLTKSVKKSGWRSECDIPTFDIPEGRGRGVLRYMDRINRAAREIAPILKEKKFDVIHAQVPGLGVAAQRACRLANVNLPIVTTGHGTNLPEADADGVFSLRQRLRRVNARLELFVDRAGYKVSDAVVSVSDFQRKEMMDLYKVPPEKLYVIHNGIEFARYSPSAEKVEFLSDVGAKGPVILFVGRLVPKKGVGVLLKAFSMVINKYPGAKCVIVGGAPIFDTCGKILHDESDKMGLDKNIVWMQSVPEEQLPGIYRLADVCVFPSENYESLPTVILEAMAVGVPVVATSSWGTPEAMGESHPGLVPQSDIDKVSQSILKFIDDKDLRSAVVEEQLQRVRKFDIESTVTLHEEIYNSVVK